MSVGLGGLFWAKSRDFQTFFVSLLFGVLIDVDHVFDYWFANRTLRIDLRKFLRGRYEHKSKRVFVLFHAIEYVPFVYCFWAAFRGRKWAVVPTVALSSHLVADQLVNGVRPLAYFLSYRAKHGFRIEAVVDRPARARRRAYVKRRDERFAAGCATLIDRLSQLVL